ncbi:MAG: LPS export ABC transporter periplasmic protein LptC [Bacteroidales bacterium]|nr:LPS export ABC transporter periplasmic protein LptC [Bacteroidales bacterium]
MIDLKFYKLIVVILILLNACTDELPKINRITSKEDLPSVAIDNIESSFTEEGRIKGILKAKRMEVYDDVVEPYTKFPKGISIVFFDKNGDLESSMTAKYAIYYDKKQTWEAIGNVVMSNIKGDVLKTNHLYGDEKKQKIYTDELVRITKSNGSVIVADSGFESNSSFTIYKFIDVSGRIAIKDEFESTADTIPQQ